MNIDGSELSAGPARSHLPVAEPPAAAASMNGDKTRRYYRIIIVGESGLGKSTARQSLLHGLKKDRSDACAPSPDDKTLGIVESDAIELRTDSELVEKVTSWLKIVDTPGYGDYADITKDIGKITDYVEQQYDVLYDATIADGRVNPLYHDSLVTCCLYFIAPCGCKDNDIAFLKEVSKFLPIVPVIAQADRMTIDQTKLIRKTISDKLKEEEIRCFNDFIEDERIAAKGDKPVFTLIADQRVYFWGTCEMENEDHSDFTLLKDFVIKRHLEVSVFLSWPGPLFLPVPCAPPFVVSGAASP